MLFLSSQNIKLSRRSHASFDEKSRIKKAMKIERLTRLHAELRFKKMLEIGTGSGYIAHFFSELGYGQEGTFAVDIVDERRITKGFNFQKVDGTSLPFPDNTFDFVISNHVIEHVGEAKDQEHHLKEIFRCLESGGVFYFSVPNRWRIIEPHYFIPFLSWFPEKLASVYLNIFKDTSYYDCRPLSHNQAIRLLNKNGFEISDVTLDAINLIGEIESGWAIKKITKIPHFVWKIFIPIMPTLIFLCRKPFYAESS